MIYLFVLNCIVLNFHNNKRWQQKSSIVHTDLGPMDAAIWTQPFGRSRLDARSFRRGRLGAGTFRREKNINNNTYKNSKIK